jgi:hypothetical protein
MGKGEVRLIANSDEHSSLYMTRLVADYFIPFPVLVSYDWLPLSCLCYRCSCFSYCILQL